MALGIREVVVKPLDQSEMARIVRRALENRSGGQETEAEAAREVRV